MGEYVIQLLVAGLSMGSIYAIVGLAYNIIYSTTGIINFSQGEFVMLAGLFGLTIFNVLGVPMLVSLILTAIFLGIISLVLERVAYRPFMEYTEAGNISWIVSTLAFGIILNACAVLLWGKEYHGFPKNFPEILMNFRGATIDFNQIATIVVVLLIAVLLDLFLNKTTLGLSIKATTNNRNVAEYMGVDTKFVIMICFVLGGVISAFAGILIAPFTFASVYLGFVVGIKGFAVAILGGLGSGRGAVIAGLLIGVLEQFGSMFLGEGYRDIIAFVILIVVIVVRPQGIFGVNVYEKA